jgi:transcriptional regulator with GAF, ATPase, and Fis domain
MDETATLVLGATGTGKERVARAIGLSRYVPFDPDKARFTEGHAASFHGVNLSAFAPAVIESELFGHGRGAFTGAVADRRGWLELGGTLFLDEIGEIGEDLQVKLLRVLQERCYQRVGETEDQRFTGKIIAATHQDLAGRIHEGTFRLDLYMRICAEGLGNAKAVGVVNLLVGGHGAGGRLSCPGLTP